MPIDKETVWRISQKPGSYEEEQAYRDSVFAKIKPKPHWKAPIDAIIAAEDFEECNNAAIWFTGGGLFKMDIGNGRVRVLGPGYWGNIGT